MEISIVKLKKIVDGLLDWVRQDLIDNQLTPTRSWLYSVFNDVVLDDHNFYEQISSLISKGDEDRRKLEVRLMFDKERANLPTIHVHYPTEDGNSGDNTINTGYIRSEEIDGNNLDFYSRSFIGQYELIITGGNSLEVVMLYEFMDSLLIAAAETLAYNFDVFKFSGKQLMTNPDIIPYLTYYRSIGISLQAKKIVPSLIRRVIGKDITFQGDYYTDSQKDSLEVSVSITTSDENISVDGSVTCTAVVRGVDNYQVIWYLDDVEIEGSNDSIIITFGEVGTYNIRCEISNNLGLLPNPAISNEIIIIVS